MVKAIRVLTRLWFRQFFRQKNKGLVGRFIFIAYFWLLELLLFFMLRKGGVAVFPSVLVTVISLSAIVPDAILKLIFERDQTVMDALIRTRPISQSIWECFLSVSQFWKPSNLAMPLIMAPACFLFLPFGRGFVVLLVLYLFSVFGGFLVMLLKRRGPYISEKTVVVTPHVVKFGSGNLIFGIQAKSLLRSKRLKTMTLYIPIIFLLQFCLQSWSETGRLTEFYLFGFMVLPSVMLAQYGMAFEAGFFGAIWTKPLPIRRLLIDKFLLCCILTSLTVLICLPICIVFHQRVTTPIALGLFLTGFGSLLLLADAYNCGPFDLFGSTFFNYQGARSVNKASNVVAAVIIMALGIGLPILLPDWRADIILAILGITGIAIHRPYFRWVEQKFLKNRYKYMKKYLSI